MKAILKIIDQVNCQITGLELEDRKRLVKEFKVEVPGARYLPAVKLGRWDGKTSFFSLSGRTYINLLPAILDTLKDRYDFELEDNRQQTCEFNFEPVCEDTFAHKKWPKGHPNEGQPILLRDYQVRHANLFLENLQGIQSISTGAGKTLLTATLSNAVEPYGRSIVIVPSTSLVKQTAADYVNIGLDVGVFYGDLKQPGHKHTIATWQSMSSLFKRDRDGKSLTVTPEEFLKDVVCVIVDETHSAKASVLKEMLTGPLSHIPIRWGVTGTVPKETHDILNITVCLGDVIGELTAKELQDRQVLSNCNVNILQLQDGREFKLYQQEHAFLMSDEKRLATIASLISKIRKSGNTLVLLDRIDTGKYLNSMIDGSVFVHGNVHADDRADQYSQIETDEQQVMICTYGVASTGINIVRLHNVVLIEPGKGFVRTIQSIGRGLRKGFEKDHVEIWDICSDCKFSKRHLTKRKAYYREAQYPYQVTKV